MTVDLVEIAKKHRDHDILISSTFGFDGGWQGQGCSVGCFAHDLGYKGDGEDIHAFVAKMAGYPEWMVLLQDEIFEGLPEGDRSEWHVDVARAVSKVTDWQAALHRVHCAILDVALETAGSLKPQVQAVRDLHAAQEKNPEKWSAAWSAARSAAWFAARSAAMSAARSAAWFAAWFAARSAAMSAARSAAMSAAFKSMAVSIIAALREEQS